MVIPLTFTHVEADLPPRPSLMPPYRWLVRALTEVPSALIAEQFADGLQIFNPIAYRLDYHNDGHAQQ